MYCVIFINFFERSSLMIDICFLLSCNWYVLEQQIYVVRGKFVTHLSFQIYITFEQSNVLVYTVEYRDFGQGRGHVNKEARTYVGVWGLYPNGIQGSGVTSSEAGRH
jgi:hypothetical protein